MATGIAEAPNAPSAEMNAVAPAVQAVARTARFDQRFFLGRAASVIVAAVVVGVLVAAMVVRTFVLVLASLVVIAWSVGPCHFCGRFRDLLHNGDMIHLAFAEQIENAAGDIGQHV